MHKKYILLHLALIIPSLLFINELGAQDPLLDILSEELAREMQELGKQETPPYYMDYRVNDISSVSLSASFGSLTGQTKNRGRALTSSVKVGDYSFDNTHTFKGDYGEALSSSIYASQLPIDDKNDAIKQTLWLATDQAYKNALSSYTGLLNKKKNLDDENGLPDFSREKKEIYFEAMPEQTVSDFNEQEWIDFLKSLTSRFINDTNIFHADATLAYIFNRKYFISTEGSSIVQNSRYAQFQLMVSIRHKGGNILPLNLSYTAFRPADLPNKSLIESDLENLYQKLLILRDAPMAEAYAGPAILSPGAAGVFFHEIFGHRIEGHRLENYSDGQTFKEKINSRVLPKDFQVYSDPTLANYEGQDLIGYYKYDDQGIAARKVDVIQHGELKNFLMSRRPTQEFAHSSGHGRAQPGYAPVSRQSNLIIESSSAVSMADLRKELIRECKKQKKEYGYYFKEVIGGLTITDRYNTNVFNITPIEVYRIYTDGRSDELVSGVDLIGTPLTMFSNIISASENLEVFTGFCGAESGHVPVTAIAPALFVKKIETQKTPEFDSKMPILSAPEKDSISKINQN